MSTSEPALEISDDPVRHRFEAHVAGVLAGFVTYRRRPGEIIFDHTETEPGFEGRGVGSHLARAVLEAARAEHLRVRPRCPFIAAYIERHPSYADLVAEPS